MTDCCVCVCTCVRVCVCVRGKWKARMEGFTGQFVSSWQQTNKFKCSVSRLTVVVLQAQICSSVSLRTIERWRPLSWTLLSRSAHPAGAPSTASRFVPASHPSFHSKMSFQNCARLTGFLLLLIGNNTINFIVSKCCWWETLPSADSTSCLDGLPGVHPDIVLSDFLSAP